MGLVFNSSFQLFLPGQYFELSTYWSVDKQKMNFNSRLMSRVWALTGIVNANTNITSVFLIAKRQDYNEEAGFRGPVAGFIFFFFFGSQEHSKRSEFRKECIVFESELNTISGLQPIQIDEFCLGKVRDDSLRNCERSEEQLIC